MQPTLRQIEALAALAAAGSFSRAAERLGMSQPALSQAVRDLERALGVRLVDRTSRRVALTAAGLRFADRAARGAEAIAAAVAEARDTGALRAGRLRLAAPPLIAATILPRAAATFAAAHPGVALSIADVGQAEVVARLRDGRADLGLGTVAADAAGIDRRPLMRDALRLAAPAGHPLLVHGAPGWAEVARHPVATLTPDSGIRALVDEGFAAAGVAVAPAWEVAQVATVLGLVAAGLAVAVLPGYAVAAAAPPGVADAPLAGAPVMRDLAILMPRDRSPAPAAQAFADHLARAARAFARP